MLECLGFERPPAFRPDSRYLFLRPYVIGFAHTSTLHNTPRHQIHKSRMQKAPYLQKTSAMLNITLCSKNAAICVIHVFIVLTIWNSCRFPVLPMNAMKILSADGIRMRRSVLGQVTALAHGLESPFFMRNVGKWTPLGSV